MKRLFIQLCVILPVFFLSVHPVISQQREGLWYKKSFIYNLDVEVFKDSNGDGVGDFKGLTGKLDYLDSLGVDAIWLSPFQPTPNKDDGYDVADFYGIDARLGTFDDFKEFMKQAGRRNIRILMDLVVNHTSDQHPWFQEARKDKNSKYRSWYVWSKKRPRGWNKGMVFPGVQKEIWSYDSLANEYFFHRFYRFQPDLDAQNPQVQAEIKKIITYWLGFGISGFRLDGVPFYVEIPKTGSKKFKHQFELIPQMRQFVQSIRKDAIILGEVNVKPKENKQYFGENGNGIHMMFNFFVNQHLFYALATSKVKPLKKALEATQDIPASSQWAQFLRNHDEIDLGRLSKRERNKVYEQFGPQKNMQLYERGIRRRLAPMLGDRKQIELAYSLLFSLPGTPVLRYGEEIGMGDDLSLKERESIRTPMQWYNGKNGGFSQADTTVRPVIDKGGYGYQQTNIETQQNNPQSLLSWMNRMIRLRKENPEIGVSNWKVVDTRSPSVLVIQYQRKEKSLIVVHNFSGQAQQIELKVSTAGSTLIDLLTKQESKADNDIYRVNIEGYGYHWYHEREANVQPHTQPGR